MAVESKRGCGYRKVGGLYLVGGVNGVSCHRLPVDIHVCPTCSTGLKYSRGWTWVDPFRLLGMCPDYTQEHECHKGTCAICNPPSGKHGLLWIGKKFYTPDSFTKEAVHMGISKRIASIPRGFVADKTWIYLAHLEASEVPQDQLEEGQATMFPAKRVPGIFYAFKPSRIEKIVTESQAKDLAEMEKLIKQGITPVIVPDDDEDHQGSVHDKENDE